MVLMHNDDYKSHLHFVSPAEETAEVLVFCFHDVFGGKCCDWHVVEGDSWTGFQHAQVLECFLPNFVEVLGSVLVLGGLHSEVQLAVGLIGVVESVSFGDVAIEFLPHGQACFVGPQSGHIVHGVASTAEQHQWHSVVHHFVDALAVTLDAEIEPAQDVVGDAVAPQLQNDCTGHEFGHYFVHHCLEQLLVGVVVDANFYRDIHRVVLSLALPHRVNAASSGEEIVAVLMERIDHPRAITI